MTKYQALVIKVWRVRQDYSWRAIHAAWQYRYIPKEKWWFNQALIKAHKTYKDKIGEMDYSYPHGNQINGMDLCEEAMKFLGENPENGWN